MIGLKDLFLGQNPGVTVLIDGSSSPVLCSSSPERWSGKRFWIMVTVVIDRHNEWWRLIIVRYKQSIVLTFDIQFSTRSLDIIYFIIWNWMAKVFEGVQHESRSCFSVSSYLTVNVFDGLGPSVAHIVNNMLPKSVLHSLHTFCYRETIW